MFQKNSGVRVHAGGSVSKQAPHATPHAPPMKNCITVSASTSFVPENFDTYMMCTANSSADASGLAYRQSESIPAGRSSKAGMFRRNAAAKGAQKPMLPASEKPAEFLFRTPWFRALLYIT